MNYPLIDVGWKKKQERQAQPEKHLHNISIKALEMENNNDQVLYQSKNPKYFPLNKLPYHQQIQARNKNKKVLPGIVLKNTEIDSKNVLEQKHRFKGLPIRRPLKNSRNSEILNSLIDILKTDPDKNNFKEKNATHLKTQPSYSNEFMEIREISSVKNSRGPKIIGNELFLGTQNHHQRRHLQSEGKSRSKNNEHYSCSLNKAESIKKQDPFSEMQMTFYKPCQSQKPKFTFLNGQDGQDVDKNQFLFEQLS